MNVLPTEAVTGATKCDIRWRRETRHDCTGLARYIQISLLKGGGMDG